MSNDDERGGRVGIDVGPDATGGLFRADDSRELLANAGVALGEELVRRMLGVARRFDRDLGVEVHEPPHSSVVLDERCDALDRGRALVDAVVREVDLVALAEDLLEQLLFRREVVQEARLADSDGIGELAHARAPVAVACDHVERGCEDLLALRDALRVGTPACHTCMVRTRAHEENLSDARFALASSGRIQPSRGRTSSLCESRHGPRASRAGPAPPANPLADAASDRRRPVVEGRRARRLDPRTAGVPLPHHAAGRLRFHRSGP